MKGSSLFRICAVTYFAATLCHMVTSTDLGWIQNCPKTCNCQISRFHDLSISKSLNEIEGNPQNEYLENFGTQDAHPENNSILNDAEEQSTNFRASGEVETFLNTAICVLQGGVGVDDFFTALPLEIQVLTVLQGPERFPISIETTHLTKFNDLQVFEIFGFHSEKPTRDENQSKLLFKADIPDPVPSLRFLQLDKVQLRENTEPSNHIYLNEFEDQNFYSRIEATETNELLEQSASQNQRTIKHEMNLATGAHFISDDDPLLSNKIERQVKKDTTKATTKANLVFVEPPNEIIPYEFYKKMQEEKRASMFAGFKNLKYLQITDSNLKEIDWQWFDDVKNLEILSLKKNQIEYIPDFTFHALEKLRVLILSENRIQSLISTSFAGLLSLETLDLSKNNLMELSDISFPPFPKLKAIDLSDNPMKFVRGNTFEVMNSTQNLYLGGRKENLKIQTSAFTGLSSLRSVEISGVQLQILERDFFRGMSDLKYLRLEGKIDYLAYDAFAEILSARVIILQNCSILALSMDTFYGLNDLEKIDLSYNNLKKLPPKLFDQQLQIKEIILTGNQLTELPVNLFAGLSPDLIQLHHNPWLCTCKIKSWATLPVNQIKRKKDGSCKNHKGKMMPCISHNANASEYVYSRSVEPRCATPTKFKGWTISKVLRKGLGCTHTLSDKLSQKSHKKQKHEQYLQKYVNKRIHDSFDGESIHNSV